MKTKHALSACVLLVASICASVSLAGLQADVDQQVLDQLKKAGSNLKKPHNIEFFLYFPTKAAAQRVAQELKKDKFIVKVERGSQGPDWLCFATRKMVPAHAALVGLRKRFDAMANKFKGTYDGWGSQVVK